LGLLIPEDPELLPCLLGDPYIFFLLSKVSVFQTKDQNHSGYVENPIWAEDEAERSCTLHPLEN
jgi:hypothetical protein